MQINVIYDQSASSLPAGFVAAVNYVVNFFDTTFTNPVTVNIDLGYGEIAGQSLGSGALGESETYFDSFSYTQAYNALKANQPSATQQAAYSTLPGSSPVTGGTLWASTAEEKALGLLAGNNSAIDGYVGVSSTYPFSYSASATPGAGQYYFDGVLAHEFSEVLGRSSMLGQGLGGTNSYTIMDLFRYSAPGARQLGTGGPAYFSINNGTTNLDSWNTNPNGDLGDWAGSAGADAFLAFSNSGQINWITQSDLTLLNVLGWDTTLSNGIVVTAANLSVGHGQALPASSLFQANDPDGDAITQYDFWDTGTGGGHFVLNGLALGANQDNYVTAAQLAQTTYQSGLGADTLWVRASDGTQWSAWTPGFTVTAPVDTGPVVAPTSANVSATHGQSFAASLFFTYRDPFGDAATQYDVWDTGSGGGSFVLNGSALGANQHNFVSAAQLAQLTYQSGTGTDTLWVRASDGTQWSAWSNSFTVTAPIDTGPVVAPTSANVSAAHGQSFTASSLFTYADPYGDAATQYDVWDTGVGGGGFVLNGSALGANQHNFVSAAQLAQFTYQSGTGTDTLWVRASDGTQWSAWSNSFTVTAPVDTGPTVTSVSNVTTVTGQSFAASSLFTASDPFGDAMTQYDFWDTGSGGGHFVLNGSALGANQHNILTAAQEAQLTYVSGSGTDTLWVRVGESGQWSPWSQSFTVSDPSTIGAGTTLELPSAYSGTLSFAGATGTLKIDNSSCFSGTIAGQLAIGDVIDLADVTAGANATIGYSGNNSPGTLTVSDGTHTASIALLGNYSLANFTASSDGHGGTSVIDPPIPGGNVLYIAMDPAGL